MKPDLKARRKREESYNEMRSLVSRAYEVPLEVAVLAFECACMLLLAFKGGELNLFSLLMSAALPMGSWLGLKLICLIAPVDRVLYYLTSFLCAMSVILLRAVFSSPDKAIQQATYLLPGFAALCVGVVLSRAFSGREKLLRRIGPLVAIAVLLWPFAYSTSSAARSWVRIGSRQFQPSELVKAASVYIFAMFFTRGKRFKAWMPGILYGMAACAILFAQRDLGALLLYFVLTVAMFRVGTGKRWLALAALGIAAGLAILFVHVANRIPRFGYLAERVSIWRDPWNSTYENARQLVQGLMSIVSGGLFGAGLGLSYARKVAVVASDYIFAAVSEEFGMVFSLSVLLIYLVIMWRGMRAALSARSRFHALLAFGSAFELTAQMLLIVCGNLHLLPLTGVTLPFISEGGSSLVGCMLLMGTLLGVSAMNAEDEADEMELLREGRRILK